MNMRFIYLLKDPETDEVKYIGQTADPPQRYEAGHRTGGNRLGVDRVKWIDGLRERGRLPEMEVIEECPAAEANGREFYWILRYTLEGARLLNSSITRGAKHAAKFTSSQNDRIIEWAEDWNLSKSAVLWICLEYALSKNPDEILSAVLEQVYN